MTKRRSKKPRPKLTKDDIDFFTAGDIVNDVLRIDEIFGSGIFLPSNFPHALTKSAFIEVMICLRDLLAKAETYGLRISFTDDIAVKPPIKDVTDLVKFMRDAVCHSHVEHHWVVKDRIKSSFICIYGKRTHIQPDHPTPLVSEYSDDVAFFFGLTRIYLNRHIVRAFREAQGQLFPLPEFPNDIFEYGSFH